MQLDDIRRLVLGKDTPENSDQGLGPDDDSVF
jgi:hypothetical protein